MGSLGRLGQCGLGELRDHSWAGCGNLAMKELPTEIYPLLGRVGPWWVKVVSWDFALSGQDRE